MPDEAEALALLALVLLQDSRRDARVAEDGSLVLLEDQDRSRWNRDRIDEGLRLLARARSLRRPGPYLLQAEIAAVHARAEHAPDTDWPLAAALYGMLARVVDSPIVQLNRAVAVAMAAGPEEGLALVERIEGLERYHLLHATRADLLRRLGRSADAAEAYRRALELVGNETERAFLQQRLRESSA
jgi:RNA polymerase sigma-70 factor (ECF subfamily)